MGKPRIAIFSKFQIIHGGVVKHSKRYRNLDAKITKLISLKIFSHRYLTHLKNSQINSYRAKKRSAKMPESKEKKLSRGFEEGKR